MASAAVAGLFIAYAHDVMSARPDLSSTPTEGFIQSLQNTTPLLAKQYLFADSCDRHVGMQHVIHCLD